MLLTWRLGLRGSTSMVTDFVGVWGVEVQENDLLLPWLLSIVLVDMVTEHTHVWSIMHH